MVPARFRPLAVDPARYTVQDAAGTVRSAVPRWRWILEGLEDVPHAAVIALQALGDVLAAAGGRGEDLAQLSAGVDRRLQEVGRRAGPTSGLVDVVGPDDPLVHAVESVDTLLSMAGRAVVAEVVAPAVGVVSRVGSSRGGVPKGAVERAEIDAKGLVGDRQATPKHHGRPSQALCVWSSEVLDALAAEGHPVTPGGAGENLLLSGLEWSALRPGVRLAIGDGAVVELTGWADPCRQVGGNFTDRAFERIDHGRHPGWSRAYAAVLDPGPVAPGDGITVLP